MGASSPLVLLTVRIKALLRSSFDDEMAIWFVGGEAPLARLIKMPSEGGECSLFDIFEVLSWFAVEVQACLQN